MNEQILLDIASKIQNTFASFKLNVQIVSIIISDAIISFVCSIEMNSLSKFQSKNEELALALGIKNVLIKREKSNIVIEIPNEEKLSVQKLSEILKSYKSDYNGEAISLLGTSSAGKMLFLRVDSPSVVHFIITGTTGSGKSALGRQIILSLCYNLNPNDLELHLIDVKGTTFGPLNTLAHISQSGVITNPDDGVLKLQELVTEMEVRDKSGVKSPLIFLGIEELADWVTTHGDSVLKPLQRLLQRGREANIHVMALTQKPLASVIGSLGRANFPIKIVGKVASKDEARFATGIKNSNAETLEGKGDFLIIHSGDVDRFKSFWFDREEMNEIIAVVNRSP